MSMVLVEGAFEPSEKDLGTRRGCWSNCLTLTETYICAGRQSNRSTKVHAVGQVALSEAGHAVVGHIPKQSRQVMGRNLDVKLRGGIVAARFESDILDKDVEHELCDVIMMWSLSSLAKRWCFENAIVANGSLEVGICCQPIRYRF